MDVVPIFGSRGLNVYLPMCLVFFCVFTYFNLFTKVMALCNISRFRFEESFDDENISEGKTIVDNGKR